MNRNRRLKAEFVLVFGTQRDGATALSIDQSRISRIINGRITASAKERRAFARAFGAERVATLLGDEPR
jgi:plasmid maintenance system antidote protein VapI